MDQDLDHDLDQDLDQELNKDLDQDFDQHLARTWTRTNFLVKICSRSLKRVAIPRGIFPHVQRGTRATLKPLFQAGGVGLALSKY